MDLTRAFKEDSFQCRRKRRPDDPEPHPVALAAELKTDLKVIGPDRSHMTPVERTLEDREISYDPKTGKQNVRVITHVVNDCAREFTFNEEPGGDHHGGELRGKAGDFVVLEPGGCPFVVPLKNKDGSPNFWEKFEKVF
jgi:hypothetical protein